MNTKRQYNPDIRENDPIYLLGHIKQLMLIATTHKNPSSLIYACLDSRIALEILDLNIILHSVGPKEREQILEDSKPKNGIDRMGKKTGTLKEKYQLFFQAVCEILNVGGKYYDFKKSKELQYQLSTYIHSYYMTNDDLKYDSPLMQNAIKIIENVETFITSSLPIENDAYIVIGMNIATIPEEDKKVLEEWKSGVLEYEALKSSLKTNLAQRS